MFLDFAEKAFALLYMFTSYTSFQFISHLLFCRVLLFVLYFRITSGCTILQCLQAKLGANAILAVSMCAAVAGA